MIILQYNLHKITTLFKNHQFNKLLNENIYPSRTAKKRLIDITLS